MLMHTMMALDFCVYSLQRHQSFEHVIGSYLQHILDLDLLVHVSYYFLK